MPVLHARVALFQSRHNLCEMEGRSIIWFRKGLRLHDNPALQRACEGSKHVFPLFVLDPYFLAPDPTAPSPGSARCGVNRIRFLLESLEDLDLRLKDLGARLLVMHGNPQELFPTLFKKWRINKLCFEYDTEPYALERDSKVKELAHRAGVELHCPVSHTLVDPNEIIRKNGGHAPLTYQAFCKLIGKPPAPISTPASIPGPPDSLNGVEVVPIPTLEDLGYQNLRWEFTPFHGGETEALRRLDESLSDKGFVCKFEKPKGDPTAFIKPATTVLSPYLKFGCLSSRLFYSRLQEVYSDAKSYTKPPVSLEGQLLWREFFYTAGYGTPRFDRMIGNPICKQIPWKDDDHLLGLWRDAQTGFPWIDAAMVQLRKWGWMHHLARHAVACFLTRGDLFVYWEKGRDVFDRLLIDADWSLNNGNWLWLSASAFFHQYHRIYSPVTFGKKYDPEGKYVKHFLPALKDLPRQYIYEPWTAPIEVQRRANCIIGKDYPKPVVDHAIANKECRTRMGAAYALNSGTEGQPTQEQVDALNNESQDTVNPAKPTKESRRTVPVQPKPSSTKYPKPAPSPPSKKQRKLTDYM